MRIMFVTPGMHFGGAERVMAHIAGTWSAQGHKVSIIAMDDEKRLAYHLPEQVEIHFMQTARFDKPGNFSKLIRVLRGYIKQICPDIIISFFSTTLCFSRIAAFGLGIPLVFSERNDPYNNINGIKSKIFQLIALNCSKHVVFQTPGARDYYGKWIRRKSTIILNPFDGSLLPKGTASKEKLLVSAGRLSRQKNQAVMIDAFHQIADRYPEYKLVIYGEGPLRWQLQRKIDVLGRTERIMLPGNESALLERIQKAEVFLFSSDFEGLPNALIEAMALGLPCVSTDCSPGGAKELIKNYENGILVPCGDDQEMAKAITYLLDDPVAAQAMGDKAKEILNRLDVLKICQQWRCVLETVVNG